MNTFCTNCSSRKYATGTRNNLHCTKQWVGNVDAQKLPGQHAYTYTHMYTCARTHTHLLERVTTLPQLSPLLSLVTLTRTTQSLQAVLEGAFVDEIFPVLVAVWRGVTHAASLLVHSVARPQAPWFSQHAVGAGQWSGAATLQAWWRHTTGPRYCALQVLVLWDWTRTVGTWWCHVPWPC